MLEESLSSSGILCKTEGSLEFHFLSKKPPQENKALSRYRNVMVNSLLAAPDK